MGRRIRVKTDRISELPLFLLHQILSYLPRKDAVITSVLSKHWNSVWHSFPILKFHECVYLQEQLNGTPEYAEKFGKFLDFVDESLRKFTQNNLRMEILDLDMTLIDVKSFPMIDTWIPLALQNDASEIHFWVSDVTGYQYPLPETTFAVKSNPGSSPFYHLQTLSLSNICLSESIIRDIIRNCPNITDLSLRDCCSLKTLELSKLEKLERLFISEDEIERLTVDAPWLEDFTFQSFDMEQNLPCVIQLTSCNALRKLKLHAVAITDDWLNSYISRSPLLESLFIFHGNMLRNVRISSNQLKSVVLRQLWQLEVLQIHAPNLSYFEFHTIKSIILLSEDVIPCAVNITHSPYGPLDSFWFLKLRQFLGVSAQSINLTLSSYKNKVSFDLEALRDVAIPPLVNIDLLDLTYVVILSQLDCAVLIDGLLWSCHPKAISFAVTSNRNTCIKVLCEKLWGIEQPLCCESSHFKCWRHGLKSVKIESFGRIEVERLFDLNILLDSLSLLGKGEEVRFILDWAFEDIKT